MTHLIVEKSGSDMTKLDMLAAEWLYFGTNATHVSEAIPLGACLGVQLIDLVESMPVKPDNTVLECLAPETWW